MSTIAVVLTFVLASNIVLDRFLGFCLIIDGEAALGRIVRVGAIMTVLIPVTTAATWLAGSLILGPLGLWFLRTLVYVFAVYGLVSAIDHGLRVALPSVHAVVSDDLMVVAMNSSVLGVSLIVTEVGLGFAHSVAAAAASGVGFVLVASIVASIVAQIETEWVPARLRGRPITFVTLGLVALAFAAFDQGFLSNLLR